MTWPWVSRKALELEQERSAWQRDWIETAQEELWRRDHSVAERDRTIAELQGRCAVLLGASESPQRLAEIFSGLGSDEQAAFLQVAGRCFELFGLGNEGERQLVMIADALRRGDRVLHDHGRRFILALAHLLETHP